MLQGETVTESRADISIELPVRASLPESYIGDESLRLQAYKKIAGITDESDSADIIDELTDRYGKPPKEALDLIKIAEIRAHAERIGAANISSKDKRIVIRFTDAGRLHPYAVVMTSEAFGDELTISSGNRTFIELRTSKPSDPDKLLMLMRSLIQIPDDAA